MSDNQNGVVVLRCAECGLPFGRIQNGALIIESRHHGERHTNTIAVQRLQQLARRDAQPWPPEMEIKSD